jgi:hypothetical protein
MNIVALCKTFAGEEWVKAMALSIYPYISKIVFVNSDISWIGRKGNKCKPVIQKMINNGMDKIDSIDFNSQSQCLQVAHGIRYIQEKFPCDYIMMIDTDEVWDDENMERALGFIKMCPNKDAYKSAMYTYIKSPLWRVTPIEPLEPVCFIKADINNIDALSMGERGSKIKNVITIRDRHKQKSHFHHFVYVRNNFNSILEKILTSHVSENTEYEDMSKWIPNVWNKLPEIPKEGIHPAIGFHRNWKSLDEISLDKLPKVVREDKTLTEKYLA